MRRRFHQKTVHHLFKAILLWRKQVFFLFVFPNASEVMENLNSKFQNKLKKFINSEFSLTRHFV
jgi:hypothetical protein